MLNKLRVLVFLLISLNIIPCIAFSVSSPRGIGGDARIKIVNYRPNTVFQFTGHYYYQSIIEFGIGEEINTITMGTPSPWQIIPSGNRIFLKPVEDEATTIVI